MKTQYSFSKPIVRKKIKLLSSIFPEIKSYENTKN
jgi:hypothetical protein